MRFPVTMLLSAFLLFCVQPMVARALVPLFGGSSSVWNACLVFFQAMLLLGYAYAHGASRWLGVRRHAPLHAGLTLAPLLVLPIAVGAPDLSPVDPTRYPLAALLWVLARKVAAPFFVLSTTSPLMARWYASTAAGKERGAYWLYAASNLGSLVALVAYPTLIEPWLPLGAQGRLWAGAYAGFAALVAGCAWAAARGTAVGGGEELEDEPLTWPRRLTWVGLAAVPASLLSGVTSYLTTDIASIPLLWVVPLGLYLLTFSLCFSTRRWLPLASSSRALVLPAAISVMMMAASTSTPLWLAIGAHLAAFFLAAMVCHGRLADDRPRPGRLTEFFLLMSLGGVLGGAFNAIAAPLLFPGLIEYPLALVLACALRLPVGEARPAPLARDLLFAAALTLLTGALGYLVPPRLGRIDSTTIALVFLLPILLTYRSLEHPRRFALGMAAVLAGSVVYRGQFGQVLDRGRSFYSVVSVTIDNENRYRQIVHGNVVHGRQATDPARREVAIGYYHREGPLGSILTLPHGERIGVVGLGVGTMATYARAGERWSFFEIDPLVARIAEDDRYFTFLKDARARGADVRLVLGDARLQMVRTEDASLDLLLLDAFSSDAIPAHLLTREALALYLRKLSPAGRLGFHVSNRFVDLRPVLAALGADAGLTVRCHDDRAVSPSQLDRGQLPSVWCVADRDPEALGLLPAGRWLAPTPGPLWTDESSSLLPLLSWRSLTD